MGNVRSRDARKSRFRYINGRRYHNDKNSKYFLPNDDEEAWVLNMSIDYPKSTFVGIDISPIFPSEIKPKNLTFLTCNLLDGLPFHDENFDYIHVRFLMTAFTEDEWKDKVIPELMRVVKRNGWVELMDGEAFESTLISNNINPKLKDLLSILLENRLNNCKSIKNLSYQERIVLIGDHNNDNCIQITTTSSSTSTSPNNSLSELLLQDIVQFMNSLKPLLIRVLNLNDQNEFDILVEHIKKNDSFVPEEILAL
nr:3696_t:CDS:2 [Entrophospora candida]